jgi:ribokinase
VIVDQTGSNIILLDIGANNELDSEYITRMTDVISKSDALLMQMEIPLETVAKAAEIASNHGVTVILNPAPYQTPPQSIWSNITILTPNEKEAKLITGRFPEEDVLVEVLGADILKLGVKNVIITLGEKGAYVATKGFSCTIPSKKVDVVDTTGAGDSFTAALGVAVSEGKSLSEAAEFAVLASALAVTKYGVIESLPYRKQVEDIRP